MEGLDSLYQEIVLDHYKSPRNNHLLEGPDLKAEGFNPFCGDRVTLTAKLDDDGLVSEVGFIGEGCAISQSSASMMTEAIKGGTVANASEMVAVFKGMMQGKELSLEQEESLGELAVLRGVREFPIRIKCGASDLERAPRRHSGKRQGLKHDVQR